MYFVLVTPLLLGVSCVKLERSTNETNLYLVEYSNFKIVAEHEMEGGQE